MGTGIPHHYNKARFSSIMDINGIPAHVFGDDADRAYLFVHGKSGSKADAGDLAEIAAAKGWQVLAIDLPSHGARKGEAGFDPWHAVPEIRTAMAYMRARYQRVALCAYSIGAWFSMQALAKESLSNCLFVSPILDMERLIRNMLQWADVSEDRLRQAGEIETAFGETLSWKYLQYAKAHPVSEWNAPTEILYAGQDNLTARATVDAFTDRFRCGLTVMEDGEHWFHTPAQLAILRAWMERVV